MNITRSINMRKLDKLAQAGIKALMENHVYDEDGNYCFALFELRGDNLPVDPDDDEAFDLWVEPIQRQLNAQTDLEGYWFIDIDKNDGTVWLYYREENY